MSGEVVLADGGDGHVTRLVEALHEVELLLDGVPHALIGGLAVLLHVPGHRVTRDLDSAVATGRARARTLLLAADGARNGGRGRVVLASGVPVDVLEAPGLPARQGLGLRTRRNEALAWAVTTAEVTRVACTPASPRGTVAVPAATRGALVATKLVALRDARRDRRESDTHDLWRLLTSDLDAAAAALRSLTDAPVGLSTWVVQQLDRTIGDGAAELLDGLRGLPGAPATVDEVRAVWDALRTELR